jgi:hypothetical protein
MTSAKLIALAVAALCASSLPGAAQPAIGIGCNASKLMVARITDQQTNVAALRELARFTFTSTTAGCVLVHFTGELVPGTGHFVFMSAKLDTKQGPVEKVMVDSNQTETRSAAFLFTGVPAGRHTVRFQWETLNAGEAVGAGDGVVWVQHP